MVELQTSHIIIILITGKRGKQEAKLANRYVFFFYMHSLINIRHAFWGRTIVQPVKNPRCATFKQLRDLWST